MKSATLFGLSPVLGLAAIAAGVLIWVAGSIFVMGAVWSYKVEPGKQGRQPAMWPAESALHRTAGLKTLVLFLHPRCPCSRSSVEELNAILSRASGKASVHVALFCPEGESPDWARTDVWRSVSKLPEVAVIGDSGGLEERRFGAATSGHAFLFDDAGRMIFSGGLTGARGHLGDNPGRQAVLEALNFGTSRLATTPVFGCPIFEMYEKDPP